LVVLIFQTFLAGKIFSQSQLDSLEIYNPYSSVDRIRKIINDNFSILSSANKAQIEAYQNSMLEDQKGNNFSGAGEKLIDIGDIYFKSGIYTNALQSYYKALNQYETNGDSINAALVKLKLARTYYFADLVPAQDFYSNAYQVLKTSNDKKILALAYYVGGLIESNQNKKSELFGKALVIQTALVKKYPHDKKLKATLATILNSNNKVEQAISIAEEIGNNWLQIVYLNNYGFDKVKSGKYDEALKIFQRSLRLCKTERNKTMLRNIYDNIARIYRLKRLNTSN